MSQQTMQAMLTNLVASTTQSLLSTSSTTRLFSQQAGERVQAGLVEVDGLRGTMHSNVTGYNTHLVAHIEVSAPSDRKY